MEAVEARWKQSIFNNALFAIKTDVKRHYCNVRWKRGSKGAYFTTGSKRVIKALKRDIIDSLEKGLFASTLPPLHNRT